LGPKNNITLERGIKRNPVKKPLITQTATEVQKSRWRGNWRKKGFTPCLTRDAHTVRNHQKAGQKERGDKAQTEKAMGVAQKERCRKEEYQTGTIVQGEENMDLQHRSPPRQGAAPSRQNGKEGTGFGWPCGGAPRGFNVLQTKVEKAVGNQKGWGSNFQLFKEKRTEVPHANAGTFGKKTVVWGEKNKGGGLEQFQIKGIFEKYYKRTKQKKVERQGVTSHFKKKSKSHTAEGKKTVTE